MRQEAALEGAPGLDLGGMLLADCQAEGAPRSTAAST
jgi:hypothetical protein